MRSSICHPDRIELFLQQKLSGEEQAAFESHLSECGDCCRRLESSAASEDVWRQVRDSLGDDQPPLNDLDSPDSALDTTAGEEAFSSQATILKLLAPTDDDRMLGRWGTYEVVGVVGTGGMGVVLKALDAALNRYVAIKILAPHLGSSGAARKRFSREAQASAAVVHDNVIEIYGVAEAAGLPYLVMPYVRGPSLQRRLDDEGPLAVVEILRVGMQAAAGLAAAHAQGLVHRDVKPANILLADGIERVKLTDFGLARAADDASLTKTGIIAGTPQYMSPEQARGEPVDQRSDLFSLGSVLYAMCTGRPPFRAETSYGVLRRITDDEPRPIREINPDIPDWLCGIVEKLMAKRPDDRFQSAREVSALLEQCLAHVQQPTAVPLPNVLISLRRDESITAERDEYDAGQPKSSPLPPGEGQGVRVDSALQREGRGARAADGQKPSPFACWSGRKRIVAAAIALLLFGGVGLALGIIIRLKKDNKTTTVEVPEGSTAHVDADGSMTVELPTSPAPAAQSSDRNLPALCFDGQPGSYVSVPNMDMDRLTFATWVKRDVTQQKQYMIMSSRNGGWGVYFSEAMPSGDPRGLHNDLVWFTYRGVNCWSSEEAVADTEFHFVAVTLEDRLLRFYVDGKPAGKATMPGGILPMRVPDTIDSQGGDYCLGGVAQSDTTPHDGLRGSLAETLIFDRALDPDEIAKLYRRGRGPRRAMMNGLIAGYHFDEGRGTTVNDFSDHGRNGTLHGGATWVSGRGIEDVPERALPAGAVQWSEAKGGNGHWYEAVSAPGGITWTDAKNAAQAKGGYLATITSAEENAFVYSLVDDDRFWHLWDGPWLGGAYDSKTKAWHWVTCEPWGYTNWYPGQPDHIETGRPYPQDSLHFYGTAYKRTPMWDDNWHDLDNPVGYVVEWNSRPQLPAPPPHSHALQFDGQHYAKVEQPPKFTSGDFTISVWFNPVRTGDTEWLFMRGFGFREQPGDVGLPILRNGYLDFRAFTAANQWFPGWDPPPQILRSPVRYGQWNHAVVTHRGDTYTMWIDGKRVGSEESNSDISDADNTCPFLVGGMMGDAGAGGLFRGALDDFRIFRRCLSDKEIGTLYDCCGDATVLDGEGRVKIGPLIARRGWETGAVQWSEAKGGNGHWYQAVSVPGGITWTDAKKAAEAKGGHLATIASAGENAFVFSLVDDNRFWRLWGDTADGPWLGGAYDSKTKAWHWVTGEPWGYTNWYPGQPDHIVTEQPFPRDRLNFYGTAHNRTPMWDDNWHDLANPIAYVVEWNSRPEFAAPPSHAHALEFDGRHYAKVDPPPKFTSGDFTISLWFNQVRVNDWIDLFARGFAWHDQQGDIVLKFHRDTGNLNFQARTGDRQWLFGWDFPESRLRSTVRYGQWNHAVVTRRGDTYCLWMNGQRVASEKSSADISDIDNTNPFIVGGMMSDGDSANADWYRGALDDFRIFRRCLSDKEIGTLYDCNGDATVLDGEGRVKIGPLVTGRGEETDNASHAHALHFDGASGYVDLGPALDFRKDSAFSVDFWMKSPTNTRRSQQMIVGKGAGFFHHNAPGWTVFLADVGFLYFQLHAGSVAYINELQAWELSTRVCDGRWHHIVVTYNGNQDLSGVAFYIDGKAKPLGSDSNNLRDGDIRNNVHATMGAAAASNETFYRGALSELHIFDRVITPAEVAKLYAGGAGDYGAVGVSGQVAGYHLDEGRGTTVADFSGHGNSGKLHGGVHWVYGRGMAAGPHANAVHFDGEHYAKVEPPPKFTSGDFTISVWFNPVKSDYPSFMFMRAFAFGDQRGDIGLGLNRDTGDLDFEAATSDNQWIFGWSPEPRLHGAVRYGQWNHGAVTRRGDIYTMWINGEKVATERSSADISDEGNRNPFIVGGFMGKSGVQETYRGQIDDFHIFRRCLSEKEVADLYKSNGDETFLQGEGRVKVGPLIAGANSEKANGAEVPWGQWNDGWSMRLRPDKTVWIAGETPQFTLDLRRRETTPQDKGQKDLMLNLGIILGNGGAVFPTAVHMVLTDSTGKARKLQFDDPRVAGRVDDFVVPVGPGSTYSLRLRLADFWCKETKEFRIALGPGEYRLRAVLKSKPQQHANSGMRMDLMRIWTGTLESAPVAIAIVQPAARQKAEVGLAREKARSEEPSAALRFQIAAQISAEYQRELERMQQKSAALQRELEDAEKRLKSSAGNSTRGAQPSELEREVRRLRKELGLLAEQTRAFEKEVAEKKREADSAAGTSPDEKATGGAAQALPKPPEGAKPQFRLNHDQRVDLVAFSPDGAILASSDNLGNIKLTEVSTGKVLQTGRVPGALIPNSMAFFPKWANMVALGCNDGSTVLMETKKLTAWKTLPVTRWSIYAVAVSANGATVACDASDGTVDCWDVMAGRRTQTLGAKGDRMSGMAFSPDNKLLLTVDRRGFCKAWDLASEKELGSFQGIYTDTVSIRFCPDGKTAAVAFYRNEPLRFWDPRGGKPPVLVSLPDAIQPHFDSTAPASGPVKGPGRTVLSADCKTAASVLFSGVAAVWDIPSRRVFQVLPTAPREGFPPSINGLAFSPDGRLLATGNTRGVVEVWEIDAAARDAKSSEAPAVEPRGQLRTGDQ